MAGHHHHHDHGAGAAGDRRVALAVFINMALTVAQIVGGILAGSLSLVADALHNFSDAASLGLAYAARRIARRPADARMTFGYVRAEIVAALINYTTLIVIGLYLVYEAIMRFFEPQAVDGWLVVIIAGLALAIDLATALLTYTMSKESMNIRAAFLHNLADAFGSLGVIAAGTLILLFDWRLADPLVTLAIAGYILWMAFSEIGGSIRLLMLGTPPGLDLEQLIEEVKALPGVEDIHHVHAWMIDEGRQALEAHVVVGHEEDRPRAVVRRVKAAIRDKFRIAHTTIEIERPGDCADGLQAQPIGHPVGH